MNANISVKATVIKWYVLVKATVNIYNGLVNIPPDFLLPPDIFTVPRYYLESTWKVPRRYLVVPRQYLGSTKSDSRGDCVAELRITLIFQLLLLLIGRQLLLYAYVHANQCLETSHCVGDRFNIYIYIKKGSNINGEMNMPCTTLYSITTLAIYNDYDF